MTNENLSAVPPRVEVTFSLAGALTGARRMLPVALGVCAYDLAFGMLARQAGLSVLEVFLMSGLVYAGSAQLIVLSLWTTPRSARAWPKWGPRWQPCSLQCARVTCPCLCWPGSGSCLSCADSSKYELSQTFEK